MNAPRSNAIVPEPGFIEPKKLSVTESAISALKTMSDTFESSIKSNMSLFGDKLLLTTKQTIVEFNLKRHLDRQEKDSDNNIKSTVDDVKDELRFIDVD